MTIVPGGLDAGHVRRYLVRPALQWIDLWSAEAEELVLATAAQESQFRWVDQLDKYDKPGPAYGLWQMEELTHDDLWDTFLRYRAGLRGRLSKLMTIWAMEERDDSDPLSPPPVEELHWNNLYAAAMCRVRYYRAPGALPKVAGLGCATPEQVASMASYWKQHYNTLLGRGTEAEFIRNYDTLVRGR